ncbi:hypothetical protein HG535_0D05120 [Zygotorulaspora mrakii]|uniref:TAFII28-like protein domain-containing protein n=1 Tax=Zygotorulaspora mrakii TaxID=42260 RepID=A0A7H9B2U4_ZYGMR|nr:uncharacterized protein HG535_0D05120 [Zygotorulaspora mrakii]QLG72803.1 hypothetical protein HG535_0D05120 [Zygotorulaspora mrakii]
MADPEGPLDIIPRTNYSPLLTMANYNSIKQMIDQVLNEDQEYVSWKLKSLRTGGTMNSHMEDLSGNAQSNDPSNSEHLVYQAQNKRRHPNRISKSRPDRINEVPKTSRFPRDFYLESIEKIPLPRELDQDEKFKLLVTNLDDEQTNRFEVFHRTSLNKTQVKKLAGLVINQSVTENIRVFLQAIGKMYACEMIELALDVRQKWFVSLMMVEFDRRKVVGKKLKKYLKKLTLSVEPENKVDEDCEDSVNESECDSYFDDDEAEMKRIRKGNVLLGGKVNTPEGRLGLIEHYNELVKEFNRIDVSVEKYANSPVLPEHIREAWRLYQLQSDKLPSSKWRSQGEGNGQMFR